jgi:hypothetical protein
MVFPGGNPKLGVTLFAHVSLSPFRFLTQEIQKSVEQLFGSNVTIKNRYTLEILKLFLQIVFFLTHYDASFHS